MQFGSCPGQMGPPMGIAGRPATRNFLIVIGLLAVLTLLLITLVIGEPVNMDVRNWIATHGVPRCGDASLYGWTCINLP